MVLLAYLISKYRIVLLPRGLPGKELSRISIQENPF